jgi:hypothetical protein
MWREFFCLSVIRIAIASLWLLSIAFYCSGQQQNTHQGFYWMRYYNEASISKTMVLHTEAENRRQFNPERQSQFFVHIHLHKKIKSWFDVAIGFNYNRTKPNKTLSIPELRPWQELTLTYQKKRISVYYRYRLDQRFIHNAAPTELANGYHFNLRHRLRGGINFQAFRASGNWLGTLKIYDELMLNTVNVANTFDQNRLNCSLEYNFNKNFSIETGYMNILQASNSHDYVDRHVIRTTLYHRVGKLN